VKQEQEQVSRGKPSTQSFLFFLVQETQPGKNHTLFGQIEQNKSICKNMRILPEGPMLFIESSFFDSIKKIS
jgi:hypothetical protein